MSMTSPRGPLPARVYWVRRTLVLLVALALVFGIGKLLTGFGGDPKATTASAPAPRSSQPTASPSATVPSAQPTAASTRKGSKVPLSVPTGTCDPARITVTPNLGKVDGGGTVALPMKLTSLAGTCSWHVSPRALVVKIISGKDRIWSSQDCSAAIPIQDVVVRPAEEKATVVEVSWSGRRSAQDCPKGNSWADVGYYHVIAASLGGTPSDVQFQVVGPPRPVVTKTTHPKPRKKPSATKTPAG
jgi:hypothetical protein